MRIRLNKLFFILFTLIFLLVCNSCITSYSAEIDYEVYSSKYENTITKEKDTIVITPKEYSSGIIFYPGAYVDYDAYLPLMDEIASIGIQVYIVKMPLEIALLDKNAASKIIKSHGNLSNWYVAGHSLGGATAAMYAEKNYDKLTGLLLFAAYSIKNLTNSGLKVLTVYGDNDSVLNKDKYEENKVNLPSDYKEVIIKGGNHSQFGSYGFQEGDTIATCTAEEQRNQTVNAIIDFIK